MNNEVEILMPEGFPYKTLKKAQTRLLEMGKIVTSILDKGHYRYCLAFGTLLGAVRHGGFIPWDDDFDIFLFDEEYDAAVACLRENIPENLVVQDRESDPTYYCAWAKIRDRNSEMGIRDYPADNLFHYRGVNIDLCRLRVEKRSLAEASVKRQNIEYLVRKHDVGMMSDEVYHAKFAQWCADYTRLAEKINPEKLKTDDNVFTFVVTLKKAEVFEILPLKKYQFEDTEFYGPNCADKILSRSYGDYMELPTLENRRPHSDWIKFNDD